MQDSSSTDSGAAQPNTSGQQGRFGFIDIAVALAESFWLIALGTLLAAAIGFGVGKVAPKTYTSVAYLALQEDGGSAQSNRSATPEPTTFYSPRDVEYLLRPPALYSAREVEALIRSPAVLGTLVKKYTTPQNINVPFEERLRKLDQSIRLIVAPGNVRKTSSLFILEVDAAQPELAQEINTALLEGLLDAVKPKPLKLARLQNQLKAAEKQLESTHILISRLEKETPNLVLPSSLQGEIATPIVNLLQKQADLTSFVSALNLALTGGIDSDTIVVPPSLPAGKNPQDLLSMIAGAATAIILSLLAIFRHLFKWLGSQQQYSGKLGRITTALMPWRRRAY